MTYEEFETVIKNELQGLLGNEFSISTEPIQRNNNIKLQTFSIKNKNYNISPAIPIDTFYKQHECCQRTISQIAEDILHLYWKIQIKNNFDLRILSDYSFAKNYIQARLVNTVKNKNLLENVPHRNICDLSVIYYIQISLKNNQNGAIQINNSNLKRWDITEEILYEQALENMKDDGLCLNLVTLEPISTECENKRFTDDIDFLYILTNNRTQLGAINILNKQLMQSVKSVIKSDFLILPTSTHELVLIPTFTQYSNKQELLALLSHHNSTENFADEILSDHIYHYHYESDEITILD